MSWIPAALSYGYTAVEIVKWITQHDKKNAPLIQKAQAAGYSPEEIVNYLSGLAGGSSKKASTSKQQQPPQKTGTIRQQTHKSLQSQKSLPDVVLETGIRSAPALAATAIATKSLAPMASSVTDMIGDYLGKKINQPSTPTPQQDNTQAQQQTQAQPIIRPQEPDEIPFATTEFKPPKGKTSLADIASGVATVFGFKNKELVKSVAEVMEKTGKGITEIYENIKDKDVNTPEKAKSLVRQFLEESEFVFNPKVKTSEETKDKLQSDLKSSVIRYTDYNPKDMVAKVVFNNGHTYIYKNVPPEAYKKLVAGQTPAKTEGENKWGMWWVGKNPSLGAAFNEHIKKPGYEYKRIADTPFEQEQYLQEATEAKEAFKSYISGEVKTRNVSSDIKSPKVKTENLAEQLTKRKADLLNSTDKILQKKGDARKEALRKNVIDRLQLLRDEENLKKTKKKTKGEKPKRISGREAVKKLLPLLPKKGILEVKRKYDTLDEKAALELILEVLDKS